MAGTECPACGYENQLGARFCSSCGQQLRSTSEEATMAHEAVVGGLGEVIDTESIDMPEGTIAMFMVLEGPKRGSRIALDSDEVLIGRHPESDVFFDDVTVSRTHAVVTRVDDGFEVSDAGSLNGTYVNQERVDGGVLQHGDVLQVGKFKLVYISLESTG